MELVARYVVHSQQSSLSVICSSIIISSQSIVSSLVSQSSLNPDVKYLQVVVDKVAMNTIAVELAFIGDIVLFSFHRIRFLFTCDGPAWVRHQYNSSVDSPIYLCEINVKLFKLN